jgi:hypothetical protein
MHLSFMQFESPVMNQRAFGLSCRGAVLEILAHQGGGLLYVPFDSPPRMQVGVELLLRENRLRPAGVPFCYREVNADGGCPQGGAEEPSGLARIFAALGASLF